MRKMAALLLLLPAGCGPTFSGSVAGTTLALNSAIFTIGEGNVAGTNEVDMLLLQISSASSACTDANSSTPSQTIMHKGESMLQLALAQAEPAISGAELQTGPYTAYSYLDAQGYLNIANQPANVVYGIYHSFTSACVDTAAGKGEVIGGTVTLDSFVDSTAGTATVDFNLRVGPQGDLVTGHVVATYCAGLNQAATTQLKALTLNTANPNDSALFDPNSTPTSQPSVKCE